MIKPLSIAFDARASRGAFGGVGEMTFCFAKTLPLFDPDLFHFTLLVTNDADEDALRAVVPAQTRFVHLTGTEGDAQEIEAVIWANPTIQRFLGVQAGFFGYKINVFDYTRFLSALNIDVFHSLLQSSFVSDTPFIYHPHDLQHIHLPDNFTKEDIVFREWSYQLFCRRAAAISVNSEWIKQDIVRQYLIQPEKIFTIPWAPTTTEVPNYSVAEIKEFCSRHQIRPDEFILYPARTWKHKNHLALLHALLRLREQGMPVPTVVFTGAIDEHGLTILRTIAELGLSGSVRFLGYISRDELSLLYQLARCTVVPTKFEAGSAPVYDAFVLGCPVACSNVTSLPAQTNGAAVLFDPDDIADMVDSVRRLWTDADLRADMVKRGKAMIAPLSWESLAWNYSVLYRHAAGMDISAQDRTRFDSRVVY